jgi:hypothetical protein
MSDGGDDVGSTDGASGAPVDFDRLTVISERFATDDRFSEVEITPEFAPDRVVCHYESGFYRSNFQ